jgi:hypothetical protein
MSSLPPAEEEPAEGGRDSEMEVREEAKNPNEASLMETG